MANPNPKYAGVTKVGSGSITKEQSKPQPVLQDVGEHQYVTLINPLPFDFVGKVAQSRPVKAPVRIVNDGVSNGGNTVTEETLNNAGISLRNKDHVGRAHVTVNIEIPAGKTKNIRGDEAKVIIKQLVNEILAYNNDTLRRGNPAYRKEVETQVVQRISSVEDLLGGSVESLDDKINQALAQKNQEEQAFPTLQEPEEKPEDAPKPGDKPVKPAKK
jgi:hypothetical protein